MTQHVRNGYRNHRRGTWVAFVALAALVAVVLIPYASGAPDKPYTFTGNASVCAGTTSATFDVTITNRARSQNLGSADLYAPANITVTGASWADPSQGGATKRFASADASGAYVPTTYPNAVSIDPNDSTSTGRSLISIRSLTLPYDSSVTVRVTASVGSGKKFWFSLAKQANDFNPGSLDTSNAFTVSGTNPYPYFESIACTLAFVTQPPNPWQKNTSASSPIEAAVFAGANRVEVGGTPTLSASGAGGSSNFDFGSATYNSSSKSWKWNAAKPTPTAVSGLYNLTAWLGAMSATSDSDASTAGDQPFRVADTVCQPGSACDASSNLSTGAQGKLSVTSTSTLTGSILIDFQTGGSSASCSPWNRASYPVDPTNPNSPRVYFPAVRMDYTWGSNMLKMTYKIKNSEWVLTDVARGNNDIDICAGARHQLQNDLNDGNHPFAGKYTDGVRWGCEDPSSTCSDSDKAYWGVLPTVSNPSKVKSGGDPAVCERGTQDITQSGVTETWRTWTVCIPYDWDWGVKVG